MFSEIKTLNKELSQHYIHITPDRRKHLDQLITYVRSRKKQDQLVDILFICAHNSRRSQFAQIAGTLAAAYFNVPKVRLYSGGTEVTAFHPNAINALISLGFKVTTKDPTVENPLWEVIYGEGDGLVCLSKKMTAAINPNEHFAAVMTCTDAEQNFPIEYSVEKRISLPYEDPRMSDGKKKANAAYIKCFREILLEMLYVFEEAGKDLV